MLVYLYIEALLVDEELADQVWEVWHSRQTSDFAASCMWLLIAYNKETGNGEDG